ncbi:eukaryotic and archaeal DNA primase small subunit [Mycobacterium ulcerans str. Harvey]|uniref:Eukaryotic and archaeal DNA primase small subunit n=1 Tax=Mycobacterium ulcerans str. Harvey TaxID=1299332 RepID=A0ABP3APE9_MYCUL|nr:eukaryotic and archaeal DNA primase small subunit [Mycobacterium ulcerans str. Harvey]
MPGVEWRRILDVAQVVREVLEDYGLTPWPKTSGSRGFHVYARIAPQWSFSQVRLAAQTVAREVERRMPGVATNRWWKEEREGVFVDFNQNAKDRTVASAYSVRANPDARVSTPLHWHEVADCDPQDFTLDAVPDRFAELGDPWSGMDGAVGALDRLLMLAEELARPARSRRRGQAPRWPPAAEHAADRSRPHQDQGRGDGRPGHLARSPSRGGGSAATRRCVGGRHARAELDLVPHPDQPAAHTARGASPAGGADRRVQPVARLPAPDGRAGPEPTADHTPSCAIGVLLRR